MVKALSKRKELGRLVREHPDWSYKQYAEYLSQSEATIRGVLSALKLSRNYKYHKNKDRAQEKLPKALPKSTGHVAGRCSTSYSSGYLKLL